MHKNMLRAFCLALLAALSLMAFAAAGAQAEELSEPLTGTEGDIRILGKAVEGEPAVTGEQVGAGTLLVPALNTEIVCQKVDVLNGKILSLSHGLGEVLYLECEYWGTKTVKHAGGAELLELTTKLPCEILEEGTLAAKAIVAKAFLLVILHNGGTYVLAEPDPLGSSFAGVLITTPGECPLPKLVTVTGSTVFKVIKGVAPGDELVSIELESDKSLYKLFSDLLAFGANHAYIDGKATVRLTSGCTWGVL